MAENEGSLPPLDQKVGVEANEAASQARRAALDELSEGSLELGALFASVARESREEEHHQLGHIHIRAALIALPHIGEKRADEVLNLIGVEPDRHLASLGSEQMAEIVGLASAAARGQLDAED